MVSAEEKHSGASGGSWLLRRPEERIGALLRDEQRAGRGELRGVTSKFGRYWKGGLVAGYTVRQLVNRGLLRPIDEANALPFSAGGPMHRDYYHDVRDFYRLDHPGASQ